MPTGGSLLEETKASVVVAPCKTPTQVISSLSAEHFSGSVQQALPALEETSSDDGNLVAITEHGKKQRLRMDSAPPEYLMLDEGRLFEGDAFEYGPEPVPDDTSSLRSL